MEGVRACNDGKRVAACATTVKGERTLVFMFAPGTYLSLVFARSLIDHHDHTSHFSLRKRAPLRRPL